MVLKRLMIFSVFLFSLHQAMSDPYPILLNGQNYTLNPPCSLNGSGPSIIFVGEGHHEEASRNDFAKNLFTKKVTDFLITEASAKKIFYGKEGLNYQSNQANIFGIEDKKLLNLSFLLEKSLGVCHANTFPELLVPYMELLADLSEKKSGPFTTATPWNTLWTFSRLSTRDPEKEKLYSKEVKKGILGGLTLYSQKYPEDIQRLVQQFVQNPTDRQIADYLVVDARNVALLKNILQSYCQHKSEGKNFYIKIGAKHLEGIVQMAAFEPLKSKIPLGITLVGLPQEQGSSSLANLSTHPYLAYLTKKDLPSELRSFALLAAQTFLTQPDNSDTEIPAFLENFYGKLGQDESHIRENFESFKQIFREEVTRQRPNLTAPARLP